MTAAIKRAYDDLSNASRLNAQTAITPQIAYLPAAVLLLAGAIAALIVAFAPLPLRVPGHAILKVIAPIVCGIAAVPRPLAGSLSGIGAAVVVCLLEATGIRHIPAAALAATLAIGPAIDLAIIGFRGTSTSLYVRFAFAGLLTNLLAFCIRWGTSALGIGAAQPHRLSEVGTLACISFAICGAVAGVVSAMIFFRNTNALHRGSSS